MCIGIMLFYIQVTFVVEQAVQNKGSISVRTFVGQAKIRSVVVRNKVVKLKGKIVERMAIAFLEDFSVQRKPLSITTGGGAISPGFGDV